MTVVRISRGSIPPSSFHEVADRLERSRESLVPAIQALPGLVSYYVGADEASGTMVNVSVWRSLGDAERMSELPEMLALASTFVSLGVQFERPILNYETCWEIATSAT